MFRAVANGYTVTYEGGMFIVHAGYARRTPRLGVKDGTANFAGTLQGPIVRDTPLHTIINTKTKRNANILFGPVIYTYNGICGYS